MSDVTTDKIIDYYNSRAEKFGTTGQATLLDDNMRILEVETVQRWLEPTDNVLEIFCGNCVSSLEFAKKCRSIHSVDLSENMIAQAQKNLAATQPPVTNASIQQMNVLDLDKNFQPGRFDTVVSVRGLINLPSWEMQQEAIKKVAGLLPGGGKLIFLEGVREGLERVNELRAGYGLPPLNEPWYDRYFSLPQLDDFMSDFFTVKAEAHMNMYFLVSRVLYPAACLPEDPRFDNICNTVARMLQPFAQTEENSTLMVCRCYEKR